MFLKKVGKVLGMELTDETRGAIGEMVAEQLRVKHRGEKMSLYRAADVNPATLDRVLDGKKVRPASLARVIAACWPHTGGDWRKLLKLEPGADYQARMYVMDLDHHAAALEQLEQWIQGGSEDDPHPPTDALELWSAKQLADVLARKVDELEIEMLSRNPQKENPDVRTPSNARAGGARAEHYGLAADDLGKTETDQQARDGLYGQDG